MKIGKSVFKNNLFLAPMADVTDYSFRTIAKKYGCGLTFTQMVSAEGVVKNNFNTLKLLSFSRDEKPMGVQLLGKDPEILGNAVKELTKFQPDIIDLNSGCPVDNVFNKKMGSYLLSQPQNLRKIIKSMVKNAGDIPISVKVRLGYNEKVNILEIAQVIEDSGASAIIIHARNKIHKYDTDANWEWISKVKESVSIPVIGNGSVFTAKDVKNLLNKTKCDGVLIARGALGNPFIFKASGNDVYEPTIDEITDTALLHLELLEREQDFRIHLDRAKKNIIWYFKYLDGIEILIPKLYETSSFEQLKKLVIEHRINLINKNYPPTNVEDIQKKFYKRVLFWLEKEKV